MPQKTVLVAGIGEILLVKRRGAKNIRLSVTANGKIRVSMPPWVPYATGIRFARGRTDWLEKHLKSYRNRFLEHGDKIGKSHRLEFVATADFSVSTRVTGTTVIIKTGLNFETATVQTKAEAAAERALLRQAKTLLPSRLQDLAKHHGYHYRSLGIKKLTSRWGSCSSRGDITLSYYLIQLPWDLIDYVLLHELVHTRHLNHSAAFWQDMSQVVPHLKETRSKIRNHKPSLQID